MPFEKVVEPSNSSQKAKMHFMAPSVRPIWRWFLRLLASRTKQSRSLSVSFPRPARPVTQIGRIASHSPTFVCGGNGIRCEAIRVSKKFSRGQNRRRSINTHCEFGEFVRRASGRSRSCLRRSSPPSRQRGIKVKGRSHNKWQLP